MMAQDDKLHEYAFRGIRTHKSDLYQAGEYINWRTTGEVSDIEPVAPVV